MSDREPVSRRGIYRAILPPAAPAAAPPPPRPTVIERPQFISKPNADDMARYYPERAQRMGVSGRVSLRCTVLSNGKLTDCSTSGEDPSDQGFGDAALKLARIFKLKPQTADGVPVSGGIFETLIRFQIAKEDAGG